MKTKEEILKPYVFTDDYSPSKLVLAVDAIQAMQEYADQQTADRDRTIADLRRQLAECKAKESLPENAWEVIRENIKWRCHLAGLPLKISKDVAEECITKAKKALNDDNKETESKDE